ncbi:MULTISPECIES: Gfo/Idh/MocA family protein [Croceitalea]|uniref:Gfo/Idh/MocA family oxidoreductase n=1 Tax=Croceitalea vernalis TaxID=3075599 RepID=A0ABU3BGV3_9FLAO|nr:MULTISPECIES: Gfo/Idh/MocA family oxidoreductase [unclassified Croceitalea]MDT0539582.1 Gfo/Idh/MocA family oxidoreductase [Croceitalea sp. P059]MDT0621374.1 Gfo/Idh/MocA family oxidoreductase [Croceitalea sp. P007]
MKKRDFLKKSAILASSTAVMPSIFLACKEEEKSESKKLPKLERLRTAHIGVGNMGGEDLRDISSHAKVDVVALCDVDANNLAAAKVLHPNAMTFTDYRLMLEEIKDEIDAVIVSTPDHTHAPASLMAMNFNKSVYCQKPLTHYVSEAREMNKIATEKGLITQMGIQVHSFYDYKLATLLIQSGIIGKVHTVRAWSPKNWGYDGPTPEGEDTIPETLDWNLWLGTSAQRPYKEGIYHPGNWRKLMDYGCGTLGDMGVHIFDTPYNALELDVPRTIKNECREPNGFGYPENNSVTYEFPGTAYTTETLKWIWSDGPGAPSSHEDLKLPNAEIATTTENEEDSLEDKMSLDSKIASEGQLPDQGAMFIGENGRLLLPHFMQLPKKIVDGQFVDISAEIAAVEQANNMGKPIRDYASEGPKHYHQFVDACLGKDECTAPFSYASKLTETILLGVIAGRFPNQTLHWDSENAEFAEDEANQYLSGDYRAF